MAITKRLVKGSALTHTELDSNFTDLDGRVTTLESAPDSDSQTLTLAGDDLTITGGNTVSLSTLSTEVVDDTSPQLGGNLDLNGNEITGSGGSFITEKLNVLSLVGGGNGIIMRTTTGAGKIVIGDQAGNVVLGNSANSVEFVNNVDVDFTNTNIDFTNATITGLSIGQGIDDLSDVDTSTTPPGVGQVLKWDGAQWEPANDSSGSGGITLTALSVTSASASASSSLVYNNTTGVFTYTPALNTWASITGKDDANGPNEVTIGRLAGSGGNSSVAVGQLAGETSQGDYSSAFGPLAGRTNQGDYSVAIGNQAGLSNQGDYAVGIGTLAGVLTQGERGIAIGYESGRSSQGADSIAIGTKAGRGSQGNNSIVLNATGVTLENTTASSLVIKPIRNASGTHSMEYNPTTGEVTYDTLGGGGGIDLTALSVTSTSASASPSLVYNNTTGVFTYTPPNLTELGSNLDLNSNDITGTGNINIIGSITSTAVGTPTITSSTDIILSANSGSGIVNASGSKITNLGTPTAGTDAATKAYVDSNGGAPLAFVGISVAGQTQVLADGNADTLTFEAGNGMIITTDSATDTIIFASDTTWDDLGDKNNANGPATIALGTLAGETGQGNYSVAIGIQAGNTTQGIEATAVGAASGKISQGNYSVAIGIQAGNTTQGISATAVGDKAGKTTQGNAAVAVGSYAGNFDQGVEAVAIGPYAGKTDQGVEAVAIGKSAGNLDQGANAVAVGRNTGKTDQGADAVAIGNDSGTATQGASAVAIGVQAGQTSQGLNSVAIGAGAGTTNQGGAAIAIGSGTAVNNQGESAIAIGNVAVLAGQGDDAIAIGNRAGGFVNPQAATSIILNATGAQLENTTADSFVVKPVRNASGTHSMEYNPTTGEITYDTLASYTNSDVDTHLNTGSAGTNQVLSWNGSYYDWVAQGGSGLQSRGSVTGTTGSLADAAEADLDITGFKSYALLTITTDRAARVRLYVSAATRTADASRAEGVDPTSDAGVIAEVITTGAETVIISPGAYGFNLESSPTTNIPCRVTNKSGGASTVQVDLNVLQLEA
jgi:hypothetical protein